MAAVAKMDWTLVTSLRRLLTALLSAAARGLVVRGTEPPGVEIFEP